MRTQDIKIAAGHEFIVTVDTQYAELCDDKRLFMDYPNLPAVTSPGKLIYIDDGKLLSQFSKHVIHAYRFRYPVSACSQH